MDNTPQHEPTTQEKKMLEAPELPELLPLGEPPQMLMGKARLRVPIKGIITGLIVLLLIIAGGGYVWYDSQLQPVSPSSHHNVRVIIPAGMGPQSIGTLLKKSGLIRSTVGFDWYTRINHNANQLQAGAYTFSPSMPLSEIVASLVKGRTDSITITFLPGATLEENKKVLEEAGFTSKAIEEGLKKASRSTTPLFEGKPASASLEGYIYGETYQFSADTTVEAILERTFSQYMGVVARNNLKAAFKSHGLTLYEGITLASIIQREMSSHTADMPQVAQVFYLRLKKDMPLGSDVTFEYAAKKLGVTATPDLQSPYNTRIHTGLPPGPIATPGLEALLAAAHPAGGDYLYFLSGDDNKTYFAKTDAEHEANIKNHCQKKCAL